MAMTEKRLMEIAKECGMANNKIEELADSMKIDIDYELLYTRPFNDHPTTEEGGELVEAIAGTMRGGMGSLPLVCIHEIQKRFNKDVMWKPEVRFLNDLISLVEHYIYSEKDLYDFYDEDLAEAIRSHGMNIGAIDYEED